MTDPSGLFRISGTDSCVDIADDNCNSDADGKSLKDATEAVADRLGPDHWGVTGQIGGVLCVSPEFRNGNLYLTYGMGAQTVLVAYAADSTKPNTTNLSFAANSTVATLAQVKVSADGRIKIYAHAQADIVIDLEAWISAPTPDSQSYTPLDQVRIADTRYGTGVCSPSCGRMGAYSTRSLEIAGHGGVPTTGVSAVVVNITATAASASGWLKAYASGDPTPDGTSVVYEAGKDVANLAVVAVGSDGRIALSNSAALDVIIDVVGYYGETTDTWTYSYSPDGIRATKTGPGTNTTYKWDRASGLSMLLSETTASVGTTYYIYGPAGLPGLRG